MRCSVNKARYDPHTITHLHSRTHSLMSMCLVQLLSWCKQRCCFSLSSNSLLLFRCDYSYNTIYTVLSCTCLSSRLSNHLILTSNEIRLEKETQNSYRDGLFFSKFESGTFLKNNEISRSFQKNVRIFRECDTLYLFVSFFSSIYDSFLFAKLLCKFFREIHMIFCCFVK